MKKINCLIADDEQLARSILEGYVSQIDDLQLSASCANGAEVINILEQQPVDLLFLDIKMPYLSGMELLRSAPRLPPVVLTTAYSTFAVESYQFDVVDYLLKPIAFDRFLKAVYKYKARFAAGAALPGTVAESADVQSPFMYVRSEKKMVKVFFADILLIEGLKDYVQIQLPGKTVITHQTLNFFGEKLPARSFMRVHRSFIISLYHISAFTNRTIEIGDREIPIGESYSREVLARLEQQE